MAYHAPVLRPIDRQETAGREFQICGEGRDRAFARTERQIIETAAKIRGGTERP